MYKYSTRTTTKTRDIDDDLKVLSQLSSTISSTCTVKNGRQGNCAKRVFELRTGHNKEQMKIKKTVHALVWLISLPVHGARIRQGPALYT